MRLSIWIAIASCAHLAHFAHFGSANAEPAADNKELARATAEIKRLKAKRPLWTWLADPHGEEVRGILQKVEENRRIARGITSHSYTGAYQPEALAEKERALRDALGMIRYARKLAPKDATVVTVHADTAASLGETEEAARAYRDLLKLPKSGPLSRGAQHGALGLLHARRGEWDQAIEHLTVGLADTSSAVMTTGFTFALVEMERGNLREAIDYLANANGRESPHMQLALAVAYDRNDEEGKALFLLERLRTSKNLNTAMSPPWGVDALPFTPAEDLHYFRALLYEASGHLSDARHEWLAYIRYNPQARYRERAKRHIKDIDALRPGELKDAKATSPRSTPPTLRPIP